MKVRTVPQSIWPWIWIRICSTFIWLFKIRVRISNAGFVLLQCSLQCTVNMLFLRLLHSDPDPHSEKARISNPHLAESLDPDTHRMINECRSQAQRRVENRSKILRFSNFFCCLIRHFFQTFEAKHDQNSSKKKIFF
jgi:hypothetical protein